MPAGGGRRDVQKPIAFGTRQERKMFPLHDAPDRLGIQLKSIRGQPSLGPGCYLSQERCSFRYSLENKPLSTRGYVIGARTAQRFQIQPQTVTPSPATYQPFWNKERECQPAYAPFSTKTPRFPHKPSDRELFPGPGTYKADKQLHKRITWPMKFGSPDWSLVPMPPRRMLKMEVQKITIDKEFMRHRNRVAYLSLYFS
ncbi:ciliary microtubule-associated protein 3 [Neopsephotus bourkii]|uniref:ciliary microtubule-associated protein 3 n=1 Tax=Neopsephotus bourkii TaxID=309878 RepID=UPI002AA5036F|nr:ciliary microtubule-associated protein 3 [Neopsephotus bourkii]